MVWVEGIASVLDLVSEKQLKKKRLKKTKSFCTPGLKIKCEIVSYFHRDETVHFSELNLVLFLCNSSAMEYSNSSKLYI